MSADDLAASIRDVTFGTIRRHEAYDIGEVDYLLDRLLAAVESGGPGNDAVIEILDHAALSEVRLREGYDMAEVNAFLAQMRERAAAVDEPEPMPPGPDPGFLEVQAPAPGPPVPAPLPRVIVENRGLFSRLFPEALMDVGALLKICLGYPGAWPDNPWAHEYPVIKVGEAPAAGKIFAFLGVETLGVKAGPNRDVADEWLDRYPEDASVMSYIGRSGWNTLRIDGAIREDELVEALEQSYRLVVGGLAKKHRPLGWDTVGS